MSVPERKTAVEIKFYDATATEPEVRYWLDKMFFNAEDVRVRVYDVDVVSVELSDFENAA